MTNTPQIDAFIKKMKTPAYAKTPLEFKYGRLMGRALRIERGLKEALRENERLRAGYKRLKESSDLAMCDGDLARDIAPPNSLPTWADCSIRVDNSDYIARRVSEGGYGADGDSMIATQLHRFIYEYDDADAYRSAWFRHRLELVLDEVKLNSRAERRAAPLTPKKESDNERRRYCIDGP